MSRPALRSWQTNALDAWRGNGRKGIVGAVTGGGKTVFALACIDSEKPQTTIIAVPTLALQDQWWEEASAYFGVSLDDINIVSGRRKVVRGTINIGVLNTLAKLRPNWPEQRAMLIIDECHKAASDKFSAILDFPAEYRLGLSATPERPYDDGLAKILVPKIGPVLFQYTYTEALSDGVIVPFLLKNVVFELEKDRSNEYKKVTIAIARTISKLGADSSEAVNLYLKRARILNLSPARVEIALRLIAAHRGQRTLVFHEDIQACEVIFEVLREHGVRAGIYHSALPQRERAGALSAFRRGEITVLVTCRALDEGFNVPETEIGIIAASTATRRQRIQRLGRVLRPANDKSSAVVYTLVATEPEIARLKEEETELEGVANVSWGRA